MLHRCGRIIGGSYFLWTGIEMICAEHDLEHLGQSTTGCTNRRYTWRIQKIAKEGDGEKSVVVVTGLSGESRLSKPGLIVYMRSA